MRRPAGPRSALLRRVRRPPRNSAGSRRPAAQGEGSARGDRHPDRRPSRGPTRSGRDPLDTGARLAGPALVIATSGSGGRGDGLARVRRPDRLIRGLGRPECHRRAAAGVGLAIQDTDQPGEFERGRASVVRFFGRWRLRRRHGHRDGPGPDRADGHLPLIVEQPGLRRRRPADPLLARALGGQGELLPNYYAVTQGSLANSIALISGQGPTEQTAGDCPTFADITPGTIVKDGEVEGS